MNKILFLLLSLISLNVYSLQNKISDGIYYAYWVYGDEYLYDKYPILTNNPSSLNGHFYMKNELNAQSNDEVYMQVKSGDISFFYKHEEVEGGPTIGWSDAQQVNGGLLLDSSTVRSFYVEGGGGQKTKYFVGDKFEGFSRPLKEREFVPLIELKNSEYKMDCSSYLAANVKKNEEIYSGGNIWKRHEGVVFINGDGICNALFQNNAPVQVKKGWVLFKKLD
ncbi:hypothetical protein [Yersinia bercovieri]|uniref:hypothetical protein n=1 Tax=Yersinia bercovieri TaxID=634 RepID=UPI0005E208E4|nr:hypothetical protein [Yersinia bercovieri]MCB5303868.1 hypothetical protein [Yersinia bercovieri]MDN0101361.1 hypothetical protein [Yersinia bercovieri]CNI53205.1 Uncharacterised protein [Yersinia bercovieri]